MATPQVQLRPRPHGRSINPDRRHTVVVGMKTSKFRHVNVKSGGKEGVFINLRQVNTRLRPESNGFAISDRWAAVPLSAAGGVIAIFDLGKPTKVADGVIPGLENGSNAADFAWCPFDEDLLAVGCDNGTVNFWTIPDDGVYTVQTTPTKSFRAHNDKINVIKFNPSAADVLATAANNGEIFIWDTTTVTGDMEPKIRLQTPSSPILAMSWSSDGKQLAAIFRDYYLRVYEPRVSDRPILESHVLETPRGARVLYVCNDRFILVSSLSKSSQRMINLYLAKHLSLVHALPLDTSSSLLIPHYDFDSSVVFLTGKGDRTIHMYEICDDAPHFLQLSPFMAPNSHQAIAFSSKNAVDVRKVEFARGARLLLSELENTTFTVPRVKLDYFQNDLFPPSLVTWEPAVQSEVWFRPGGGGGGGGADVSSRKFKILKPDDMEPLYNDIYVLDIGRYGMAPENTLNNNHSTPLQSSAIVNGHQDKENIHQPKQSQQHSTTATANNNELTMTNGHQRKSLSETAEKGEQEITTTAISLKTIEDGMLETLNNSNTPPPSPADSAPSMAAANDDRKVDQQQQLEEEESPRQNAANHPKRLSIDPNCGTPLRDLLRRCDDMPGGIQQLLTRDDEKDGLTTNEGDNKDWD